MKIANLKWILRITLISLAAAAVFAFASSRVLENTGYLVSFIVLVAFVLIGIAFDIIAVAVTAAAANEAPFNSMATRRQPGATIALRLLRNANRVSSYCADVIGDVTGIVSGTISALITARLMEGMNSESLLFPIIIIAVVTALTVGGKAAGKVLAFRKSTNIVIGVGRVLSFLRITPFSKQDKHDKAAK